jgi:hypothetical protein
MRRVHSFEFTDQSWFPQVFRSSALSFLETMYRLSREANQIFAKKILEVMQKTKSTEIIDLASGATGPILHILRELKELQGAPSQITLTDLFPTKSGIEKVNALQDPSVRYLQDPVDATNVPKELTGLRTIFGAFHHLTPELGKRVLQDAFNQRRPLAVFEISARKAPLFALGLTMPVMVLFITPLIRPVRASQLLFTYLLPILPLLIAWDGLVSVLRTYTPEELREMTRDLVADDYHWEIGELAVKGVPVKVPYLIGTPLFV